MFGNIICPGLTSSVSFTPAWLHSQLKNIYGSSLIGLWVGEDMVINGSNQVTSWPGRVGGTLAPIVANTYRSINTLNSRKTSVGVTGARRGLVISSANVSKSYICVIKVAPLPMPNEWDDLVSSQSSDDHAIVIAANGDTLYTTTGWSHYVNGIATETLAGRAGETVIIEGSNASVSWTGVRVGSHASQNWTYSSDIACVISLSAVQSVDQRALSAQLLRSYYSL